MSERLSVIKSFIVAADTIADVGCDHGLIAEYCAVSGLCKRVIASDISEKCLQKTKVLLGNADNVTFVCCDGIKFDCDEAVISGMGGILISDILRSATHLPKTVIVSPHRDCETVRTTLLELGYGIERDLSVIDRNKYYAVIRGVMGGGVTELDELQMLFGVDCGVPSAALKQHLRRLYGTYIVAAQQNAARLSKVIAAMRLQGIEPDA